MKLRKGWVNRNLLINFTYNINSSENLAEYVNIQIETTGTLILNGIIVLIHSKYNSSAVTCCHCATVHTIVVDQTHIQINLKV